MPAGDSLTAGSEQAVAPDWIVYFATPWRQALFYALLFAGTGASLPFIPVWFGQHGMNASQIGLILALPLLGRAVTGPLSGVWADRFPRYRSPMLIMAATGAVAYGLMALSPLYGPFRFAAFLALYFIGYTSITNIGPLLDAMTLQLSRVQNFSYAAARAAGSAAFIFANVALGWLMQAAGVWVVLVWIVAAGLAVGIIGRMLLQPHPRADVPQAATLPRPSGRQRFRAVMRDEGLLLLLLAAGLLQAAHAFYYAFSTIIWQGRGISATACGFLWAAAVVGEIGFLAISTRVRHAIGSWKLLMLGAAFGVVRWAFMAFQPPLALLFPLQLLHGLSFAAVYIASLDLVFRLAPTGTEGLAQTINSAYSQGLMTGIATLVAGLVFQTFGPRGYALMAGLAMLGFAVAYWLYTQRTRLLAKRNASG